MRYINFENARFNLNTREKLIKNIAEWLVAKANSSESYGLGGKEDFLKIRENEKYKWGHSYRCNSISLDNKVMNDVYKIDTPVSDLQITMSASLMSPDPDLKKFVEVSINIASGKNGCKVGKRMTYEVNSLLNIESSIGVISELNEVVDMVKYIIVNGFKDLYSDKTYNEICNLNFHEDDAHKFFMKNIYMKEKADYMFNKIKSYLRNFDLNTEETISDKHGIGLTHRRIFLSDSCSCFNNMEKSFIGIEYDDSDMKISFINDYYKIHIVDFIYGRHGDSWSDNALNDKAERFAKISSLLWMNGPIKDDNKTVIDVDTEEN